MTDRFNAFVVTLDRDMREDDAQVLIQAIRQLRGVLTVVPHLSDISDVIATQRAQTRLREKLLSVLTDV